MTATQFRAMLAKAKLSQRGAARLFKKNERTTRRYATGEWPIPDDIADKLRKLAAGKITVQDIADAYAN
jgi:hypothetical protein